MGAFCPATPHDLPHQEGDLCLLDLTAHALKRKGEGAVAAVHQVQVDHHLHDGDDCPYHRDRGEYDGDDVGRGLCNGHLIVVSVLLVNSNPTKSGRNITHPKVTHLNQSRVINNDVAKKLILILQHLELRDLLQAKRGKKIVHKRLSTIFDNLHNQL